MQLFLTDFVMKGDDMIIGNKEVLEQFRKVMRGKKGDRFFVQNAGEDGVLDVRLLVEVVDWDGQNIYVKIVDQTSHPFRVISPYQDGLSRSNYGKNFGSKKMFVAMPNRWDKAELIVQKLTEIGIDEIVFWIAERSVIRQVNDKKIDRLNKIIRESVEQSFSWIVPVVKFEMNNDFEVDDRCLIFDISKDSILENKLKSENTSHGFDGFNIGVVGPEGGLTEKDYSHFKKFEIYSLGENVLRMETASILGGWILKN